MSAEFEEEFTPADSVAAETATTEAGTSPTKTTQAFEDKTFENSTSDTMAQASRIFDQVVSRFGELDKYLSEFVGEYRRPLIALGLVFGLFVAIKLTLAILDAINDVPVLAPLFELIGLTFTGWFVLRYLLKASNRRELISEMNALKDQVLGRGPQV
ncbi:CAAD domain-containing protein [Romeria aff. gracilis LEGE 07310]|uniref:CAAD domain-containing protein n=1 Tax=Vasconcelosia minhoensis LEGE 07310 TaxID=915328 RepID=A0A8J7AK32_9CYAN|nr:CAAD domain-containing protein [Romeria gracilis]MBE9080309.1 CAAD domain-containing protein [Romeria aff. gracilis LEGE 07310]